MCLDYFFTGWDESPRVDPITVFLSMHHCAYCIDWTLPNAAFIFGSGLVDQTHTCAISLRGRYCNGKL